jgi:hypothetical protein
LIGEADFVPANTTLIAVLPETRGENMFPESFEPGEK